MYTYLASSRMASETAKAAAFCHWKTSSDCCLPASVASQCFLTRTDAT
jgi:hypothetical protein